MEAPSESRDTFQGSFAHQMLLNVLAGGCTGIFTDTLIYPLETVKTLVQINTPRVWVLKRAILWRGIAAQVFIAFPSSAVYFASYEAVKLQVDRLGPESGLNLSLKAFLANIVAETASALVTNPVELVKQKIQAGEFARYRECIAHISSRKGHFGFYQGLVSLLTRELMFSSILMPVYEVGPAVIPESQGAFHPR